MGKNSNFRPQTVNMNITKKAEEPVVEAAQQEEPSAAEPVVDTQETAAAVEQTPAAAQTPDVEPSTQQEPATPVEAQAPESDSQEVKEEVPPAQTLAEQAKEDTRSEFQKITDDLLANGTAHEKAVVTALNTYVQDMRPGNIRTEADINTQQITLWQVIRRTMENGQEFGKVFPVIINYFREYGKACFDERYLFRGAEFVALDKDQMHAFLAALNLIKLTATSVSKREASAQVDLNRTMVETVYSDDARNRVIAWYKN